MLGYSHLTVKVACYEMLYRPLDLVGCFELGTVETSDSKTAGYFSSGSDTAILSRNTGVLWI
jgi:hypothetical protein